MGIGNMSLSLYRLLAVSSGNMIVSVSKVSSNVNTSVSVSTVLVLECGHSTIRS